MRESGQPRFRRTSRPKTLEAASASAARSSGVPLVAASPRVRSTIPVLRQGDVALDTSSVDVEPSHCENSITVAKRRCLRVELEGVRFIDMVASDAEVLKRTIVKCVGFIHRYP